MYSRVKALILNTRPVATPSVFTRLLQDMGIRCTVFARTGIEALHMATLFNFDVFLVDCQTPGDEELEACRTLQRSARGASRRFFVALSAEELSAADEQTCLDAGVVHVMRKPIRPRAFYEALEQYSSPVEKIDAPDSGATDEALIDVKLIEGLSQGSPEVEREIRDVFFHENAQVLEVLRRHVQGDNSNEAWREASQYLQSSAAMLGAEKLNRLCQTAQDGYRYFSHERKGALLTSIESSLCELKEFFESRLERS